MADCVQALSLMCYAFIFFSGLLRTVENVRQETNRHDHRDNCSLLVTDRYYGTDNSVHVPE